MHIVNVGQISNATATTTRISTSSTRIFSSKTTTITITTSAMNTDSMTLNE